MTPLPQVLSLLKLTVVVCIAIAVQGLGCAWAASAGALSVTGVPVQGDELADRCMLQRHSAGSEDGRQGLPGDDPCPEEERDEVEDNEAEKDALVSHEVLKEFRATLLVCLVAPEVEERQDQVSLDALERPPRRRRYSMCQPRSPCGG